MGFLCWVTFEIDARAMARIGAHGKNSFSGNVTAVNFHTLCKKFAARKASGIIYEKRDL